MATQVAPHAAPRQRRHSLVSLVSGFALLSMALLFSAITARADPAVEYMKQAAKDLIAAARTGSQRDFMEVVQNRGHVPAIGNYALGNYQGQLRASDQKTYYEGMVRFIARYAASEAPKYVVSHAEILTPVTRESSGVYVDSRVHLQNGTVYDVRWLLVPQGNSFRIRDAQVLGFWMSPFLKNLFENYIGENGGNPQALVIALNR